MRCTTASIGLIGRGIEIDARGLADLHFADLPFRHESAQIDLAHIEQRHDGGAGRDHFARLGGACHHGAVEWRGDDEILPIFLRLRKLEPGLLSGCVGGGDLGPAAGRFACARSSAWKVRMPGLERLAWAVVSAPRAASRRRRWRRRTARRPADRLWSRPACPGARRPRRFSPASDKRRYRTAPVCRDASCWARSDSAAARLRHSRLPHAPGRIHFGLFRHAIGSAASCCS